MAYEEDLELILFPSRSLIRINSAGSCLTIIFLSFSGTWNVPHVSQAYLMKGEIIRKGLSSAASDGKDEASNLISNTMTSGKGSTGTRYPSFVSSRNPQRDADMAFSESIRDQGIFIYVTNLIDYGHLVNPDNYDTNFLHPDLHQIINNQKDWESKYLHPNYSRALDPAFVIDQPCPDVYWFPILTPAFCDELIQELEHFGKWSSGTNQVILFPLLRCNTLSARKTG